ncbi:unnamed protein product [Acidithrix sp. C25]|nr:unnamed protein product [Acidithrix sp. C25]
MTPRRIFIAVGARLFLSLLFLAMYQKTPSGTMGEKVPRLFGVCNETSFYYSLIEDLFDEQQLCLRPIAKAWFAYVIVGL